MRKTRRSRVKYPGLVKGVNSKLRHEYMDEDYIDKLNDEEKQWLSNFNEEWLSGNFSHKGEIFHKTVQEKRDCYNRNNARNRDIQAIAKATGRIVDYESAREMLEGLKYNNYTYSFEDFMVEYLDRKRLVTKDGQKGGDGEK